MDYLLEISRIIDGAVKGNQDKVLAYVQQLARKLNEAGDIKAAARLLRTVEKNGMPEVTTSSVKTSPQLPVDNESRLALADEQLILLEDVKLILDSLIERQVSEFIRFVKAADKLFASPVGIAPTMLIYGIPGVGKTELARYIAAQLDLPLITARSDSLISSFLGSTAKNLRTLFEHTMDRPCILFLDELDSFAKLRDDQHELGELKRVVVSLLQNIDALDNQIVLLAATNHQHLLDPAIWRRFKYKLELKPPNFNNRKCIFNLFLNDYLEEQDSLDHFASLTDGATGADIRDICEKAIRIAILDDRKFIDTIDVLRSIIELQLSVTADFSNNNSEQIQSIHNLNPKVFTIKQLAALFNSSETTIFRRLNEGGSYARKRKKTANQGSNTG